MHIAVAAKHIALVDSERRSSRSPLGRIIVGRDEALEHYHISLRGSSQSATNGCTPSISRCPLLITPKEVSACPPLEEFGAVSACDQ